MQNEDYDIDSLSKYLHIEKQKVEKLTNRGRIPGRRVDGQWRFSPQEIHHWLEQRLGVLDQDELAQVEGAMARQSTALPEDSKISSLLSPETISIPFGGKTKTSVIQSMSELAASTGLLWDIEKMASAIREREEMQTTALESGVALLHPRRPLSSILGQPILALGVAGRGVPFGGNSLTDVFWLICSTDETTHLKTLARLSRIISNADVLDEIRAAEDAQTAYDVVCAAEAALN